MGSNKAITEEQWTTYLLARKDGFAIAPAAAKAGFSRSVAMRMRGGAQSPEYRRALEVHKQLHPKEVVATGSVDGEAARALKDFGYFRLRYFGRHSTPWQLHAAEEMVALLESDEKEYVVINVPPGAGKSTLFTHDVLIWLICRNRSVRIMIGSATEALARKYGRRIRQSLERTEPVKNDSSEVERGLVADGSATLIDDFGRFKPANRDLWRADEFVVEQEGGKSDEKEATVTTYGRDGGILGGRFDLVIWDDLVTSKVLRTAEARENLIDWWDGEAESRLEPGGVMILQGQRLHADDLYRHCLDKTEPILDGDEPPAEGVASPRQYRHILYKAHHTEVCGGLHKSTDPAYDPKKPDDSGCLIDPRKLTWRELQRRQENNTERFLVLYQQEDVDPAAVLVNPLWVAGGRDPETGEEFPGCWDETRSTGIIPKGLAQPWMLLVSADPSPTKYWSVQLWLMHPATEQRILIDHYRGTLTAPDFLGYDLNERVWTGILEDWWQKYKRQGHPFRHIVVERNAAQRFLLQYDHVKKWMAARSTLIIPHDTYANKTDPDYGVLTVAPHWKFGRVRLPGNRADGSRGRSMALVDEAKRWPESRTTDCVMAHWMAEFVYQRQLRNQLTRPATPPQRKMPSWLSGR